MRHHVPRPNRAGGTIDMSWVVPSIAAEVWGVSLDHVMSQVRAGAVASREEFGFLWVEVTAQTAPRPTRVRRRGGRRARPQTYTRRPIAPVTSPSVGADELLALGETVPAVELQPSNASAEGNAKASEEITRAEGACAPVPEPAAVEPPEPDECESPEDPDDGVPMNWRQARSRTASSRRKPVVKT